MAQFKEIMALRLGNRSYSNIAAALGFSNRDITKVQAIIDDHNITPDSFPKLSPAFFNENFTDQRHCQAPIRVEKATSWPGSTS